MTMVTRSNFYFKSYPYPYSYPSVISPFILPTSRCYNHENNQRSNCPCLSSGSSCIRRRYNDLYNHDNSNSGLSALYGYGYGYGYGIVHGYRHLQYPITKASKRALGEEKYYNTEDEYTREEQRWLREEQRWLREETRWNSERDSLLRQISHLTHEIQDLEMELEGLRNRVGSGSTVPETLSKIASLLRVLNTYTTCISTSGSMNPNQNQILEYYRDTSKAVVLEHSKSESEAHKTISPPAVVMTPVPTPNPENKSMATHEQQKLQRTSTLSLRMGSEGEEVRALQEALLNLGFYSGEEDMEYSSFSSGTQLAVKTWQASIGGPEDGIMTAELLEKLYATQQIHKSELSVNSDQDMNILKQDKANGAPTAFVTEVVEVQQTVVKKGPADVEISQQRVYLLGENRWEDPSRLKKGNDKQVSGAAAQVSVTTCLACRGEGCILCIECDGTGEPNIEPQFLEWVEEGLKCPYCGGLGYTVCDSCEGKAVA